VSHPTRTARGARRARFATIKSIPLPWHVTREGILRACAANNVVVEINANPWLLDVDWRWHQRALELGCMFSINPDAHDTSEIALTHWGVEMARKGGVAKERVLNCLGLSDLRSGFASGLPRLDDECKRGTAQKQSKVSEGEDGTSALITSKETRHPSSGGRWRLVCASLLPCTVQIDPEERRPAGGRHP
jgi:hypothetical protein